jgi:hypothetical protein
MNTDSAASCGAAVCSEFAVATELEDDPESTRPICASFPDGCYHPKGGICRNTTHRCTGCHKPIHSVICVPEGFQHKAEDGEFWCMYCVVE